MDYMEIKDLPNEILMRIFEYLNYDDLKDASLVCHQWYDITHTNRFLPSLSNVKVPLVFRVGDIEFMSNTDNFHNFKNWSFGDHEVLLNRKYQFDQRDSIMFLDIDYSGYIEMVDMIEILLKFKNLEELKLRIWGIEGDGTFKNTHSLKKMSFSQDIAYDIIDLIRLLDLFSNIESLKIYGTPIEEKHIEFIISKYGKTLKELHLIPEEYELNNSLIKLSNLNLKKLECNSVILKSSNFEEFIKTQKDLVYLNLSKGYLASDEFIAKIIENLKNLVDLKLKCKDDNLFKIMKLKNFKKLYAKWKITRDMQELYQGIWDGENNVFYKLRISCRIETEILSKFFKAKFSNLEVLDLSRCSKVVTDSLLQLIFKNCTNLLRLDLSDCTQITDKGITGINFNKDDSEEGVSIANLKGLRSLNLWGCENITDFSLEFGLKFLELREISLMSCWHITRNGLEHLAQNCPSIARLRLNHYYDNVYEEFRRFRPPVNI